MNPEDFEVVNGSPSDGIFVPSVDPTITPEQQSQEEVFIFSTFDGFVCTPSEIPWRL